MSDKKNNSAANSKKTATKKIIGRPFQKGQSGNPSGRPTIDPKFTEIAKSKSLDALNTLIKIYENEREQSADRIRAASLVLAYGVGKPIETLNLNSDEQPVNKVEVVIKRADDGPSKN